MHGVADGSGVASEHAVASSKHFNVVVVGKEGGTRLKKVSKMAKQSRCRMESSEIVLSSM